MNQIRTSSFAKAALLGLVFVTVSSCAVLEIDVDVYKGPLSNEESVQLEQLAGMAIGAKPLLIGLRDRLESDANSRFKPGKTRPTWYEPKFIPPPPDLRFGQDNWFKNEHAVRVNGILFLYEDDTHQDIAAYVEIGKVYLQQYSRATNAFSPDPKRDKASWKRLKKARNEAKLGDSGQALFEAYRKFLDPVGSLDDRQQSNTGITGTDRSRGTRWLEDVRVANNAMTARLPNLASFHKALEALADPARVLVRQHAEVVLGENANQADVESFADRVQELAKIKLEERQALTQLLDWSLEAIIKLNIAPETLPFKVEGPTRDAISLVVAILKTRDLRTENAKTILNQEILNTLSATENVANNSEKIQRTQEALSLLMKSSPYSTATSLLSLHRDRIKNGTDPFGLTVVNADELPSPQECQKWFANIAEAASGSGLDKGRLPWGLETLIENYLLNAYDRSDESTLIEQRRLFDALVRFAEKVLFIANYTRLLDGAQRVNIGTGKELTRYIRVLQAVGNSILTQIDEERFRGKHLRNAEESVGREAMAMNTGLDRYPAVIFDRLVLQFGDGEEGDESSKPSTQVVETLNSLRDEVLSGFGDRPSTIPLVLQATDQLLETKAGAWTTANPTENAANNPFANAKAALDARKDLLDLRPGLAYEAATTDKEVLDGFISTLQYEYIDSVRRDGKTATTSKHLAEALKTAYDYRQGKIYLRMPSAYLRNSFPSPTLQEDPQLGWTNMLIPGFWRGSSVGGWWQNIVGKSEAARVTSEIDKQFWQNINHVRVSGGGRTNYVLVKDDVGNWYVKGYSSNPDDIIKSAKGVALFSLAAASGGAGAAGLLSKVAENAVQSKDKAQPTATASSQSEKRFAEFKGRYEKGIDDDFKALKDEVDGLPERISALWTASGIEVDDEDTGFPQLLASSKTFLETGSKALDPKESDKASSDSNEIFYSQLRLVLSYRNRVTEGLRVIQAGSQKKVDTAREAQDRSLQTSAKLQRELKTLLADLKRLQDSQKEALDQVESWQENARSWEASAANETDPAKKASAEAARDQATANATKHQATVDDLNKRIEELDREAENEEGEDEGGLIQKKRTELTNAEGAAREAFKAARDSADELEKTRESVTTGGRDLDRIVQGLLDRSLDRRERAAASYEAAIEVFGQK